MSIVPLDFSGLISFDNDEPLAGASYYLQDEDDRPTLLAFSLVCSSFRAAALPLLFRNTRVWLRPRRKPDLYIRSFISFLSSHQHIARLIKELTIAGTTDGQKGKAESTRVKISDVGKLMAQLSALQTLVFEGVWLSHDLQAQVTRRSGLGHARLKELRLVQMDSLMRPEALFHLLVGGAFASIDGLCVREMGKLVGAKADEMEPSRSKDHKLQVGVLLLRDVDWSMVGYLWAISRPSALVMEVECKGPSDAKSLGKWLSFPAVGEQVCDLTVNFATGLREHANSGCTQRIDILDLNIWKCTALKSLRATIYLIDGSTIAPDVNDRAWDILLH
ncbi:hypothetical protein EIP86_001130 [Pleurotus ostreatoroseus]|nr:hypothetical protein EIP86_001130 [Pleurotus ostreatoroseus]